MINNILMLVSAVAIGLLLFTRYQKAKMQTVIIEEEEYPNIEKLVEAVKLEMVDIIKEDYSLGLSAKEFNALYRRKARIEDALKNCVYGIDSAKVIVIELIRGFITENLEMSKVDELLGLAEGQDPSDHIKFEIIMYKYKQKYGKRALTEWMRKNNFTEGRHVQGTKRDISYFVDVADLHMSYDEENFELTDDEKVDVLSVLVYQLYKGFGIVDTLREMDINGFNMGTSGSILSNYTANEEGKMKATNAVWLYLDGVYIHLRFMNYGSEEELKRIVQLLVRYNNPGPLTAKRGYMVNTMYDKSRILAMRPPASEYWAIFVRKFSLADLSPEALIIKDYTTNGEMVIDTIEYLLKGQTTCAVTGRQGSGKTTLMSSIIRFIDPRYNIRVLEMAPELYLRELYPTRNILSVQETTTVTAAELQDALKKSDAAVSIVGEVAEDIIAARMIQMGQVASLFTIFSHHANTARDLVYAIRNSLVNAGGFSNMDTAERQVTEVIKMDIHLDYTPDGKRYIERISEIIPLEENEPYPEIDPDNVELSKVELEKEYYRRRTDRISFYTHNIIEYDLDTHTYYTTDRLSPQLEKRLRGNLDEMTRREYDMFVMMNWGRRKYDPNIKGSETDEVYEAVKGYIQEQEDTSMIERVESVEEGEKLTAEELGLVMLQEAIAEDIANGEIKGRVEQEEEQEQGDAWTEIVEEKEQSEEFGEVIGLTSEDIDDFSGMFDFFNVGEDI